MIQDIAQAAETVENVTGVSEITINIKDLFYIILLIIGAVSTYFVNRFKVQRMEARITGVHESLESTKDEVRRKEKVIHDRITKNKDDMDNQLSAVSDKLDGIAEGVAKINGYLEGKDNASGG